MSSAPITRAFESCSQVVTRARRMGFKPLLYYTPIDDEMGTRLLGPAFERQVRATSR